MPGSPPRDETPDGTTLPWRSLLAEATQVLGRCGVDQPAQEARWLVEEASGLEGAELVLGLDDAATVGGVRRLDAMVARRSAGEPLQYVLGHWPFRTLDLMVDRRVLIPRPETEVVAGRALVELDRLAGERPSGQALLVADIGTGSGAIALAIAVERPQTRVWATDASAEALAVARANLVGIGRAATRVVLAEGSWFTALDASLVGKIDLVVSNPPYVAAHEVLPVEVAGWEPASALVSGPTGLEALDALVDEAPTWLAPGGSLVVELAPGQAAAVAERASRRGFAETQVGEDLAGRERLVVARLAPR
jgi:release factor glutamine methyltransferase